MPGARHNSNPVDRDRLHGLVQRIEAAEDDKLAIAEDIRGLYQKARLAGLDATALRQVIKPRKQDKGERDGRQAIVDEYMSALGDYASTPLGAGTIARATGGLMPPYVLEPMRRSTLSLQNVSPEDSSFDRSRLPT